MVEKEKIIAVLISVGKTLSIKNNDRELLSKLSAYNIDLELIEYPSNISDENIIYLFKGFVVTGNYFNWGISSVSPAIFIYRKIKERKQDSDLEIANWAFLYSDNDYIPFGSAGNIRFQSKNAFDYVRNTVGYELLCNGYKDLKKLKDFIKYGWDLSEEALERIIASHSYIDELFINELNQKVNSLQERINKFEETIKKINKEKHDLKQRIQLSKSTPLDKAKIIIGDDTRPVYFYTIEIEEVMIDKSVPKELLEEILSKFRVKENANNNILKNRLLNEINNR